MTYLSDNACSGGTVAQAALHAGVSVAQLSRLFRRHVGQTPTRVVLEVRVKAASEMLAKGVPAVRTATTAGFSDQAHMTRAFRRLVGLTPAQFVRAARKNVQEKSQIVAHTPSEQHLARTGPIHARGSGSRDRTHVGRNAGKEVEG